MRIAPLVVVLAPVLVIACEDDPTDCVDQGGVCFYYRGYGVDDPLSAPASCERPLEAEQCRPTITKDPSGPFTGCCVPRTCAEGRGTCSAPCAPDRVLVDEDPACPYYGNSRHTPCCAIATF